MIEPHVTVMPHKMFLGWFSTDKKSGRAVDDPVQHPCVPALGALGYEYDDDAHFMPYALVDSGGQPLPKCPRLTKKSHKRGRWEPVLKAQGLRAVVTMAVIDVDAHGVEDVDQWFTDQLPKLRALGPLLQGLIWYRTRGGYRLLWALKDPLEPSAFEALHTRLRHALSAKGITGVDDKCRDWTRCYRLPRVVRDGVFQQYPMYLSGLGPLNEAALPAAVPTDPQNPFTGVAASLAKDIKRFVLPDAIPSGERNDTMYRYACKLHYHGVPPEDLLEQLVKVNEARCMPPMDEEEIQTIAEGATDHDDPRVFQLGSQTEMAHQILEDMELTGGQIVFSRGVLWQYQEDLGIWKVLERHRAGQRVMTYDGAKVYVGMDDKTDEPKTMTMKIGIREVHGVYKLACTLRSQPTWFDRPAQGICFANGFVQVKDGKVQLKPFNSDHRVTTALPYDYVPGATPQRLLKAMNSWFRDDTDRAEKIQFLREFSGMSLVGEATRYAKGVMLLGEGSNGKSTFINALKSLFPKDRVSSVPPQQMDHEYYRDMLQGALLNCVSELPETDIMKAHAFKAILAGDQCTARAIRQEPYRFYPRAGHIVAANRLPRTKDLSHGFFRRWVGISFNRDFKNEEGSEAPDVNIGDKLAGEQMEFICWALEGAAQAQTRGRYTVPGSSRDMLIEWHKSSEPILAFIEDVIEEDLKAEAVPRVVYQRYRQWALQNGCSPLNSMNFFKSLSKTPIKRGRKKNGRFFRVRFREG